MIEPSKEISNACDVYYTNFKTLPGIKCYSLDFEGVKLAFMKGAIFFLTLLNGGNNFQTEAVVSPSVTNTVGNCGSQILR